MPLYEYECDACGHRFEVIQKFSDPAIDTCPKCGSSVHKLMSSPAIQFKGSGWYITDYARKDSAPMSGEKKTETNSESKTETKTESSSASTPAPASSAPSDKS